MAIIAILSSALGIVLAKLRSNAMVQAPRSDIQAISNALEMYKNDIKCGYPVAPWSHGYPPANGFACEALYAALTNKDNGGTSCGWGGATDAWDFITDNSRSVAHFLDPWGVPYYYISHDDYLRTVAIHNSTEDPISPNDWPQVWGTTIVPINQAQIVNPGTPTMSRRPHFTAPPQTLNAFFNPTTFQLHSKGPDQKTSLDTSINPYAPTYILPCTRGRDPDDINNWAR